MISRNKQKESGEQQPENLPVVRIKEEVLCKFECG